MLDFLRFFGILVLIILGIASIVGIFAAAFIAAVLISPWFYILLFFEVLSLMTVMAYYL